MEIASYKVRIV